MSYLPASRTLARSASPPAVRRHVFISDEAATGLTTRVADQLGCRPALSVIIRRLAASVDEEWIDNRPSELRALDAGGGEVGGSLMYWTWDYPRFRRPVLLPSTILLTLADFAASWHIQNHLRPNTTTPASRVNQLLEVIGVGHLVLAKFA